MMQEEEFDSDTSDEDYVLEKDDGSPCSSEPESDDNLKKKTNQEERKKINNNVKSSTENITDTDTIENDQDGIKLKERENELWADFLSDVDETPKPIKLKEEQNVSSIKGNLNCSITKQDRKCEDFTEKTVKITKIFEFAGEEVRVEEDVAADSNEAKTNDNVPEELSTCSSTKRAGASGLLNMIQNKKQKLSTLQKTKLDWNTFKKSEGIDDELELHKKSKSGYLEKQDFLTRSDLKQFEIEKEMRSKNRSRR